jgi:hypothetical protein
VPQTFVVEARESIKADVTIETAVRVYSDGSKEVAFNGAVPMRTRRLDASAIRTQPLGKIVYFQLE